MSLAAGLERHPGIWRGNQLMRGCPGIASGFAPLDAELPGGGWPCGALTELLPQHEGIGELRILGPALAQLAAQGKFIAWIAPPYLPYAPALGGLRRRARLAARRPLPPAAAPAARGRERPLPRGAVPSHPGCAPAFARGAAHCARHLCRRARAIHSETPGSAALPVHFSARAVSGREQPSLPIRCPCCG